MTTVTSISIKLKIILGIILLLIAAQIISYTFSSYKSQNKAEFLMNHELSIPIFGPNTWIFNQNTAQYSTRFILTREKTLIIEALTFFNYETEKPDNILARIKCLVLNQQNRKIQVFNLASLVVLHTMIHDKRGVARKIWKVRCSPISSRFHLFDLKNIRVALTDFEEYLKLKNSNLFVAKTYLLSFHKTTNIYDLDVPAKKAVGHCVHMVRDLNKQRSRRIRNWLNIQKNIGIHRVRFYFSKKDAENEQNLKMEFGNFVQITDYRLDFQFICKLAIQVKRENKADPATIEYLYENCRDFHRVFFDESKAFMLRSHEKVCTNDCLLNFKYEYEFGTNYDFDEFIFPRHLPISNSLDYFLKSDQCNLTMPNLNYNIYEYAVKLTQKYGKSVAYFHFQNVAFLTYSNYANLIKSLNTSEQNIQVVDSGKRLFLKIKTQTDFYRIEKITRLQDTIDCFNKTIREQASFDSIWNMPYAILINNRFGKSIYNMNLTSAFSQHDSDYIAAYTRKLVVPVDLGFVSHFRENFSKFLQGQVYSFSHFYLDLEYYQFVAHLNLVN